MNRRPWRHRTITLALALSPLLAGCTPTSDEPAPPPGLLEALLAQAEDPGLRARAAVPARGAVSGARPGLSVVLLLVAAAASSTAGYALWRSARAIRALLQRRTRAG